MQLSLCRDQTVLGKVLKDTLVNLDGGFQIPVDFFFVQAGLKKHSGVLLGVSR
jgi:hypothetical protein